MRIAFINGVTFEIESISYNTESYRDIIISATKSTLQKIAEYSPECNIREVEMHESYRASHVALFSQLPLFKLVKRGRYEAVDTVMDLRHCSCYDAVNYLDDNKKDQLPF